MTHRFPMTTQMDSIYLSAKAALARDVKNELDNVLNTLSGKGKGTKGKRPKGAERKKLWEEVRSLRKEYDYTCLFCSDLGAESLIGTDSVRAKLCKLSSVSRRYDSCGTVS